MAQYGAEVAPARNLLRAAADGQLRYFWPHREAGTLSGGAGEQSAVLGRMTAEVARLSPRSEGEKALQLQALGLAADLSRTRWMALAESGSTIPVAFLVEEGVLHPGLPRRRQVVGGDGVLVLAETGQGVAPVIVGIGAVALATDRRGLGQVAAAVERAPLQQGVASQAGGAGAVVQGALAQDPAG